MLKDIIRLRRIMREKDHRLEGLVIEALENGALDVFEVLEHCRQRMENVDEIKACKMAYRVMSVDEVPARVPSPEEAVIF